MIKNFLIKLFQKISDLINYLFTDTINEKKLLRELKNVQEKIIVFDLGTNLGTFVDKIVKIFGINNLQLHLFEPQDQLYEILLKKFSKIGIINKFGIGKENGLFKFYINSVNSQSSFLINHNIGEIVSEVMVEVKRLDKYIEDNEITKIDVLKIDVEGKELDVLISMGNYLEEKIAKYIKIEMSFNEKQNFTSVNEFLYKAGYYLLGFSNMKYYENKLLFVDAYYTC